MYRNEGSVGFASLATKSEGKDGKKGVGGEDSLQERH